MLLSPTKFNNDHRLPKVNIYEWSLEASSWLIQPYLIAKNFQKCSPYILQISIVPKDRNDDQWTINPYPSVARLDPSLPAVGRKAMNHPLWGKTNPQDWLRLKNPPWWHLTSLIQAGQSFNINYFFQHIAYAFFAPIFGGFSDWLLKIFCTTHHCYMVKWLRENFSGYQSWCRIW